MTPATMTLTTMPTTTMTTTTDDDDDDEPEDALADEIDFVVAAYREDGQSQVVRR